MAENNQKYLLLLKNSDVKNARAAFQYARKLKILVVTRYTNVGIIVLGTAKMVEKLYSSRLFIFMTSTVIDKKTISSLSNDHREIAILWNHQFSKSYVTHQQAHIKKIESGEDESEKDLPLYFSKIDSDDFMRKVKEMGKAKKLSPIKTSVEELLKMRKIDYKNGGRKMIVRWLRAYLKARYKIFFGGIVYKVTHSDLAYFMHRDWEEIIFETGEEYEYRGPGSTPSPVPSCRKLHGQIAVGIIFVNSSLPGGPVINQTDRATIASDITTGLEWLATEHPSGNLSFVYDSRIAIIDAANQDNLIDELSSEYDEYWRHPGIGALGFDASRDGIVAFKNSLITQLGTDDAVVFFVTKYGTSWHAYSLGEYFISLSQYTSDWDANGVRNFSGTAPHELLHQFGAADEYDASIASCTDCNELHGCDQIPNGNCVTCANPSRSCVMKTSYRKEICEYTRGQIGWADIFVELTTDDELYSGTQDRVFLDIGHKTYLLDLPNIRDRKRTYTEGYAIFDGGSLVRNQIKRILIRKEDGGNSWKLKRVRVFHDGEEFCDESPAKWLKDHEQFYLACNLGTGRQIVHKLELRVKTADLANAGTDSEVRLSLAGHEWVVKSNTNDFGRGLNQTYNLDPKTGLRIADLTEIFIVKSRGAVGGGRWRLEGLELIINDQTIYENNNINEWLDNDNLIFSETISPPTTI